MSFLAKLRKTRLVLILVGFTSTAIFFQNCSKLESAGQHPSSDSSSAPLPVSSIDAYGTRWADLKVGAGGFIRGMDIAPDGTKVIRTDTYGAYVWTGMQWQQLVTAASMPDSARVVGSGSGVYEIRVAPSNTHRFYMFFNNHIYRSEDRGANWVNTAFAPKSGTTAGKTNKIYVGSMGNGVYVSSNAGATWAKPAGGPTTVQNAIVSSDSIYYAADGSNAWKLVSNTWTSFYGPDSNGLHSIAIDPANANRIIIGSYGGNLNQSTDKGVT